jgi:hypothetical protein
MDHRDGYGVKALGAVWSSSLEAGKEADYFLLVNGFTVEIN